MYGMFFSLIVTSVLLRLVSHKDPLNVPRFLFSFSTEFVVCRRIEISELDLENLKVSARGYGETLGEKMV